MESLQFYCLNTAVSLLSKEDMQKVLLGRVIQIESVSEPEILNMLDETLGFI